MILSFDDVFNEDEERFRIKAGEHQIIVQASRLGKYMAEQIASSNI